MRILVVHQIAGFRCGPDRVVEREVRLLEKAGVEVEIWSKSTPETNGLLGTMRASRRLSSDPESRIELSAVLEKVKPRLVHCHNLFSAFTPSIYDSCNAAKIPVVQTIHDFQFFCASGHFFRHGRPCELCLKGNVWPALRHACRNGSRLETLAYTRAIRAHRKGGAWRRKVSALIAPSKFAAGKLQEAGLDPEKIFVKPHFSFPPSSETLRASDLYGLYVGRLTEEKGIRTLLKAWEGLEIPLWIVGDGPLRAEVEGKKNQFIKVLGEMPGESVSRIMSKAEFLIVPSERPELFSLVIPEAFSLGLPVVAARTGALGELIRHEKNGLLFEPGNAQNLQSIVKKIAEDTQFHDRLGEGARIDYREKFSPKLNLIRLLEIYQEALKNPVQMDHKDADFGSDTVP